jgi:hypothetical protein
MDNKHRAILFAGVVFFVLIVTTFWTVSNAQGAAARALELQREQIIRSKQCVNNCDKLIEGGEINCEWIECHEKCQAKKPAPYCQELE